MQKLQKRHTDKPTRHRIYGPVATIFDSEKTGTWRLERPVINYSECIKCGICEMFCPGEVITINRNQKECIIIDLTYCKGCGICANECPQGCIKMVPEGGAV